MPLPDRSSQLQTIPAAQLVADLLRQFNKPTLLGAYDLVFTKSELDMIAAAAANHEIPQSAETINKAMRQLIQQSLDLLRERFGFTYAESIATTDMGAIDGWETTAEFLEIANEKNNAELRISAGASLMAFFGDLRFAEQLFTVMENDQGLDDVDALIARRALSHAAQIAFADPDWREKVEAAIYRK